MAWASRALAVARAWGLVAALGVGVLMMLGALGTGDTPLSLPVLGNPTTVLHVMPVLGAIAVGFPLVDRWPELTLLAPSAPWRSPLLRLLGCVVASLPVVAGLVGVGWTLAGASVAVGFVGLVALAVPLLRLWYWAPMLVVLVLWARLRPASLASTAAPVWLAIAGAALAAGGAVYVGLETARVQRSRTSR
ncbi:hypothetical protein [Pimelobacter simplex]|uniref:hypothetical protein n=1 Tax=Nocardioides simplex TaxID=2045 RepID=UPI003AAE6587